VRRHALLLIVALLLAPLASSGCQKKAEEKPQPTGLAAQFDGTVTDMRVMRAATAAANQVIRNSMDCDVVKASLDDARTKLDEAMKEAKTGTGRASIEALRRDVERVASGCP
jgi:hypothetical protein